MSTPCAPELSYLCFVNQYTHNNMNKRILTLPLLALACLPAAAQEQAAPAKADTTAISRHYDIGQVVVTGTRNETDIRHLPLTVSILGREAIEQSLQPSLLPILTEQIPGLFVTSRGIMGYGVSDGAAGGISLRGLSGSSGRLMVLIDGHPQYMGLFGHPIADAAQSLLAERVEVLRGPASVLYGSNAMGGVVNIVTRRMHQDGIRTDVRAGYGSYNTLETEATNRIRIRRFSSIASFSYNRTDGHRPNLAFEQFGGYAKLGYDLTKNWNVRADANVTHFNASQPGSLSELLEDADQRVTRGMASFALENNYANTSGALSFFYNWGDHWINDGYTIDPDDDSNPRDYRFISHDQMMGISAYQSGRLFRGNRLTAGIDWYRFGGEKWNKVIEGEQKGERTDYVEKHNHEIAAYVDFRQSFGTWLTLDAGIRIDHHSHVGTEYIPAFGLAFHLPRAMELKASAAKGFRYPTLREMYMFPPQNPDLRPESLWNYELALSQPLHDGRFRYGINLFHIRAKNLIVTVPREGATPLNQNTGTIRNTGAEAQIAWRIGSHWSIDANYSFLHMETPVLAAPEHKLYAGALYTRPRWSVSTGIQYLGNLYTAVPSNGRGSTATEDAVLWNLRAQFHATRWLDLWARGENLLAQRYEINAGYPMPRATALAGIRLNF